MLDTYSFDLTNMKSLVIVPGYGGSGAEARLHWIEEPMWVEEMDSLEILCLVSLRNLFEVQTLSPHPRPTDS